MNTSLFSVLATLLCIRAATAYTLRDNEVICEVSACSIIITEYAKTRFNITYSIAIKHLSIQQEL